ncbi:MAG: Crp/Fnr family transcriptional regulator [Ruminococcus sp.]|nr:Crp/Fnr family transcriptional regulator [Ruminococcus sp.]
MNSNSYLNKKLQDVFESEARIKKLPKGSIIYHQGDKARCFYYLKKGRVKVVMTSPDGMEKTLSTASGGEILGEAAFFDKMPRISSAYALTNLELVAVDESKLISLIKEKPELALELLEIQATRIRQLSAQIDSMAFMKADGRIARLLLQSVNVEDGKKTVNYTHEEIAGIVGVSRVTVSKILNEFKRKELLFTDYGKIILLDTEKLRLISNVQKGRTE